MIEEIPDTTITVAKSAARKAAFGRRAAAHSDAASRVGAGHLLEYLTPHRGRPISGYMPIRTEIDPLHAMAGMAEYGPVGVPVVLGDGMPLEFRRWDPTTQMVDGPFGAKVPAKAELVIPEIVILPLLAFDSSGHRLGYGGGYYDRTLEVLRRRGPVVAVGFAYAMQMADQVPSEPTDQRLDAVVTETGILTF